MGVVLRREQSKPCPHATKEYSCVERICKQSFGYFGEHINPFAYIKRINCWWEHLSRHKFDYTRVVTARAGTDIPSPKRDIKATSASLQTTPSRRRRLYSKAVKPMKSYLELAPIPGFMLHLKIGTFLCVKTLVRLHGRFPSSPVFPQGRLLPFSAS
jgi:hypothetical protein